MTQTHTPGPWHWTAPNNGGPATEPVELVGADHTLAGITLRTLVNANGKYLDDLRAANARLIAAAPDLLAALRRCLRLVEFTHLYEQRSMTAGDANEVAETLAQTRAAIAKTTGRE